MDLATLLLARKYTDKAIENVPGNLPDYSAASEGDVLTIDSSGEPAWATIPAANGEEF